jgi:predicted neuraminidase
MLIAMAGCSDTQVREEGRASPAWIAAQPGLLSEEFIGSHPGTSMCHASTIVQVDDGLVAAWFGGNYEGHRGVSIWSSRCPTGGSWSEPVQVADGVISAAERYACWNPVLFKPQAGPLLLFYKVGPSPRAWWGMLMTSSDGGRTWSAPRRLPDGILGPIKNKPIALPDGALLCPSSTEDPGLRVFSQGWRVFVERTADLGVSWTTVGPINDVETVDAIQPTLLRDRDQRLHMLCRSRDGWITEAWSSDSGHTWGAMTNSSLPNPNSGIDAVTLSDGRQLVVYNHCTAGRDVLNVAISDDGKLWRAALLLEDHAGEFSYPAVIQGADGLVHITYSWQRERIRHLVVDPGRLVLHPLPPGRWSVGRW